MPYSTCCNAHTNFTELDICPYCKDYCNWEYEEDLEKIIEDEEAENNQEKNQLNK